MDLSQLLSDPYNRRARLQPALYTVAAVPVASILLFPDLKEFFGAVVGLAAFCGGMIWLTQVGRDRGKALEPALFDEWGGKPSVALLRHSDDRINGPTKQRYHAFLSKHVSGLQIPAADAEAADPAAADNTYDSACRWLIENTRDKKRFRLIFEENMNYGFRRNFLALKGYAVTIDLTLFVVLLVVAFLLWTGRLPSTWLEPTILFWLAVVAPVVHLATTTIVARREWVKTAADAYATQLLAACDSL